MVLSDVPGAQDGGRHGATTALREARCLATGGLGHRQGAGRREETTEDHDEELGGSDDPTRATFAFVHALALADAGHEVQVFLTGEATSVMRKATADQITPVAWPSMSEVREKVVANKRIQVFS